MDKQIEEITQAIVQECGFTHNMAKHAATVTIRVITTPTSPADQVGTAHVQNDTKLNPSPAGQEEAVAEALKERLNIVGSREHDWQALAQAAIKASGAEHIAGLVAKNDELRDALLDMVWQFCSRNDKLAHSFMSAEEHAFDVLDLDNGMTYEEAEAASKAAALPPGLRGK